MDINAPNAPAGMPPLPLPPEIFSLNATGRIPDVSGILGTKGPSGLAGSDRLEFSGQQSLDAVTRKIMKAMRVALKRMADERAQARMEASRARSVEAARREAEATDTVQASEAPQDPVEIKAPVGDLAIAPHVTLPDKGASTEAEKIAGSMSARLPVEAGRQKPAELDPQQRLQRIQPEPHVNFGRLKLEKAKKLSAEITAAIDASPGAKLAGLHRFDPSESN